MTAHGYSLKGPFVTGNSGKGASVHKTQKKLEVRPNAKKLNETWCSSDFLFMKTPRNKMNMRLENAILYCHIIPHFNLV